MICNCPELTSARIASSAVKQGLVHEPRALTLALRWVDLDRVRLDFRWHACVARFPGRDHQREQAPALATLRAESQTWGLMHRGHQTTQWIVLDSRN